MNMAAEGVEHMNKRYQEAFDLIKYVFKIDELYDDQMKLIKAFCNGQNIFFNAPTGYGKSIVFQSLPWVYDILQEQTIGISTLIVISPLKSLMEDQCNHMKEIGISSIALYSENSSNATTASDREYENILKNVREGEYSLVLLPLNVYLVKKRGETFVL